MVLPKRSEPRHLMVEGPDDAGVCNELLKRTELPLVSISDRGGYEKLRAEIGAEVKVSGRLSLGIVVDADLSAEGRWTSLCNALAEFGYDLPPQPDAGGTVAESERWPRLGIWIMPDNASAGMVEDFIVRLMPPDDSLMEHARTAVADIPENLRKFSPLRTSKAEVHTWLAWQEEPGRPMGQAVAKRYLSAQTPQAQAFISWLKRLFG